MIVGSLKNSSTNRRKIYSSLKASVKRLAQFIMYAAALIAIFLLLEQKTLSGFLNAIGVGIGVNLLSSIIERVANEEVVKKKAVHSEVVAKKVSAPCFGY